MKKLYFTAFFLCFLAIFVHSNENRPLRSTMPAPVPGAGFTPSPPRPALFRPLLTYEVLNEPLTRRYIERYTNPSGVAYLNTLLERASLYLPFIKEEVRIRGLPPELAYLPVIESSFINTAISRSGAMGLWQFMMNSISPFNIVVNDYVDERRDIMKATRGALQKLENNYRTLGSWELALAAYNVGLGATRRTIQSTGLRDFWQLIANNHFRQETTHFVPRFMAAAYVLSNARKYGINYWHDSLEWTAIPLNRQVSIETLSNETGVDITILRRLNAELIHGITPPNPNHLLKIPVSYVQKITQALEIDSLNLLRYFHHTVRGGDTLWSMSRHYGVSLYMIERHNPGISARYLRVGETVVIPAFRESPPPPVRANVRFDGRHTVRQGDTLWSLSRRFGIRPQDLAQANNMDLNSILHAGRVLRVPIIE